MEEKLFTPEELPIVQREFAENFWYSLCGAKNQRESINEEGRRNLAQTKYYLIDRNSELYTAQALNMEKMSQLFGIEKGFQFLDVQLVATSLLICQGKSLDFFWNLPTVQESVRIGIGYHVASLTIKQRDEELITLFRENPHFFNTLEDFAKYYTGSEGLTKCVIGSTLGWYHMLKEQGRKNKLKGFDG